MKNFNVNRLLQNLILLTALLICLYLMMPFNSMKFLPKELQSTTATTKPFENVLLVLIFNFPHYGNIPYLREMYEDVFGKVVFCGQSGRGGMSSSVEEPDFVIDHMNGYFGYHCAAVAMEKYPGYEGYMSGNDDMVINWWNLVELDRKKVWEGFADVEYLLMSEVAKKDDWAWWESEMGLTACKRFYKGLQNTSKDSRNIRTLYETALTNGNGSERCAKAWSDFFYVPQRLTKTFMVVSHIAFENRLFLEIAVSTIMRCLDDQNTFENVKGFYFPSIDIWQVPSEIFWMNYNHSLTFIHPFKFHLHTDKEKYNMEMLTKHVIKHTKITLDKGVF